MNSPTDQTRRRTFTLDGSNNADSRKNTPKPQYLSREQAFSSQTGKILKASCYRNYCIDFKQISHNDRDHQVVIVGGSSGHATNPRSRTAAVL